MSEIQTPADACAALRDTFAAMGERIARSLQEAVDTMAAMGRSAITTEQVQAAVAGLLDAHWQQHRRSLYESGTQANAAVRRIAEDLSKH